MKFEDKGKVELMLNEAQKGARVRTCTYKDIEYALSALNKKLSIFTKASLEGYATQIDCNAQHFASSYRYTPQSTIVSAYYKRGWRIASIRRDTCQRNTFKSEYPTKAMLESLEYRFDRYLNELAS